MTREAIYSLLEGETDSRSLYYGRFMTVVILISLVPLCFKESNLAFDVVEYVCVSLFIIDYLMRLITADFKLNRGKLSFLIYPFTPMAIIDLLTIMPAFLALNPAFRSLRVLRLFRALRGFRLIRNSKSANAIAAAVKNQRDSLLVVLGLAIVYILMSAIVVYNVEPDSFESFFDALYWAVVSLTTVGYGDLYPISPVGRTVAMISSLMGIAVVALPSGILTAGLLEELSKTDDKLEAALSE